MPIQISTTGAKLIALIENARELAIQHQQRTVASGVVRACSKYATALRYDLPQDMLEDLAMAILEKQSGPLADMFDDVQSSILKADKGRPAAPRLVARPV